METNGRRIEIFAPFEGAFELTKLILFQPFDLKKWFVVGFAAFLAGLSDGSHFGFSGGNFGSASDWSGTWKEHGSSGSFHGLGGEGMWWLIIPIVAVVVVLVVAMIVLFGWLGARGRFMFIDCIVYKRGAIEAPWREYRREANSFFLFSLLVGFGSLVILALSAFPFLYLWYQERLSDLGLAHFIYGGVVVLLWGVAAVVLAVTMWFMVPLMYRQRCRALDAFKQILKLVATFPGSFVLYVLFVVVLMIAGALLSCLVTCMTCCLAGLPYIGTVILLPLYTFNYAYTLLFLRQFGPEYDVWANTAAIEPEAPPVQNPPAEPPPLDPPPLPA